MFVIFRIGIKVPLLNANIYEHEEIFSNSKCYFKQMLDMQTNNNVREDYVFEAAFWDFSIFVFVGLDDVQ